MTVEGKNVELVDELVKIDPSLLNMVYNKGNTTLDIATRKDRAQVIKIHFLSFVNNHY